MATYGVGKTSKRLVLCLALLMPAACQTEQEAGEDVVEQDPNLPPARVDLPDPPPASAFEVQDKNPDGTFRVNGLIQFREKHLNSTVQIRGVIQEISPDCDPKRAEREGTECPEPHFVIRDATDPEQPMMVVGYEKEFVEKADLKVDQERLFEGEYKKVASGFVASENGLLLLNRVDDIPVIDPD